MFGQSYQWNMTLEIFLRYLKPGIQDIASIQENLSFIPPKNLAKILKTACEKNLIHINFENKTIFMSKKTHDVINFIETYNFIEEIQSHQNDRNHQFSPELNALLERVNYFSHNRIAIDNELANCMKQVYNQDYSAEILKFGFWLNTRNPQSQLEEQNNEETLDE